MHPTPAFILSLVSLLFGFGSSVFFLWRWWADRPRNSFVLVVSVGILLLYLFQIPFVLANGGVHFVQARFNPFFVVAFLSNFVGMVLVYCGLVVALGKPKPSRLWWTLGLWYGACLVNFVFDLFISRSVALERPGMVLAAILFFIPIRLAIFTAMTVVWTKSCISLNRNVFAGALLVQVSILCNVLNYIFTMKKILYYPRDFWFVAIVGSTGLQVLGIVASVCMVAGLYMLYSSFRSKSVI